MDEEEILKAMPPLYRMVWEVIHSPQNKGLVKMEKGRVEETTLPTSSRNDQ